MVAGYRARASPFADPVICTTRSLSVRLRIGNGLLAHVGRRKPPFDEAFGFASVHLLPPRRMGLLTIGRSRMKRARRASAVLLVALMTGVLATSSNRLILISVGGAVTLALKARQAALVMVGLICCLGFVRRIVSGGRIDGDPLLLVPVALLILAIVKEASTKNRQTSAHPPRLLNVVLFALVLLPIVTAVVVDGSTAALYTAGLFSSCFVAILAINLGALPDIRSSIVAAAPATTILLSAYGIYQFRVLPGWDQNWIVASKLTSVGQPLPGQVRVFGTLESPGPYAMVLASLILLIVHGMVFGSKKRLTLSAVALATATPALFLSGVRTGLLTLALVMIVVLIKTRRVGLLLLVSVLGTGVWYVGQSVLGSSAAGNVFVADRYSASGIGQDQSLQQRFKLLDQIGPGLTGGMGSGWGTGRSDNLFVDALLAAGPAVGILLVGVVALVGVMAVRFDWTRPDAGFHLVAAGMIVFTFAGSILTTTSGLLVALVWGWVLHDGFSKPRWPRHVAHEASPLAVLAN
jgi:hypothetical protein